MTEEAAGAETPAAEVETTEAIVASPESTPEQPATENAAEQAEPDNGDEATAQPKKKHWAHERIDELTRQRREAERQAEYWKTKASRPVDVDSLDYEEGIAERTIQRTRQEQAETATESARMLAVEAFNYRETLARERYTDYDTVTRNQSVPITKPMAEVIMDLDAGPEIAYHLGKNPQEAARIAALPERHQALELGRLEAKITAPKSVPKPPPAPVNPVGGNASGGIGDLSKMSMAEYVAARAAGKI